MKNYKFTIQDFPSGIIGTQVVKAESLEEAIGIAMKILEKETIIKGVEQ